MTTSTDDLSATQLSFLVKPTGDDTIDADLKYMRDLDWSSSSIGPISLWPHELLILINLAMLSPQPQLFLLGPDSIILYNTAYGRLLCDHHPLYQGRPIALDEALIAQAPAIGRIVDSATTKAKPANENHVPFFFLNKGRLQEVFLSATMVQLPQPLSGYHATTYNTTSDAVQERRAESLDLISAACVSAPNLSDLLDSVLQGITDGDGDICFAILYRCNSEVKHDIETDYSSSSVDSENYTLHGTVGSFETPPDGQISLSTNEKYITSMCDCIKASGPVLLRTEDGSLPKQWCQASRARCYGDDCLEAVVLPSALSNDTEAHALLVIGLAPRRPYDNGYENWIRSLHRTFANAVTSVVLAEARVLEKKTAAKRAAREREILEKELALRKQEAALATGRMQRMLGITQSANVGIFECFPTGHIIQANDAFYELSGCSRDISPRKQIDFFDLCFQEDVPMVKLRWNALMVKQPVTFAMRFKADNQDVRWIQAACVSVVDENANVTSITGCTTDISAQKKVEQEAIRRAEALEQLRLSETRLLKFTENAPLGILVFGRDKRPSFANNAWFRLTRHPHVQIEEIDIVSVLYAEDVPLFTGKIDYLIETGKPIEFETRLACTWRSEEGESRGQVWVLVTAFVEIVNGSITQIMSAMTDISHLKFSASLQRVRLEEAIEARRQQENFIDMTSHEIRNPLGAVMHCADSITQSLVQIRNLFDTSNISSIARNILTFNTPRLLELLGDVSDSVDTITSCSTHQKRITDDILSLSKLDSNLLEVCPSAFSATKFLTEVYETFKAEAARAGITFTIHQDPSMKQLDIDWIQADPGRIMQVIVNLITNSIKFTKDEEGPKRIDVCIGATRSLPIEVMSNLVMARDFDRKTTYWLDAAEDSLCLWFTVQDTGCGMDAQGRTRMFSRFSQASPKTFSKYGGSGLGLFISQKLVELQGGEIGFTSEFGAGSTFAFFVKANQAAAPNTVQHEMSSTAIPSMKERGGGILSLLLVEDNLVNQKVLKKQLTNNGFKVFTADNGQEAFDFIKSSRHWTGMPESAPHIDVICLDIEMPVVDGLTCARMIRTAQRKGEINSHIPIIAVTANARPEQLRSAIDTGMDDAISKPFRVHDLKPIIERLVLRPMVDG